MIIVRDSREQRGFDFLSCSADLSVEDGTLQSGDYSLKGFENKVSVERKSLADLIMSISTDRDRFLRELDRAKGLESFCIVCEGSWSDLTQGRYRSRMAPAAASATCAAIMSRYHIPIHFAGSREAAELFTAQFLRQYLKGKMHEMDAVKVALADNSGDHPGKK